MIKTLIFIITIAVSSISYAGEVSIENIDYFLADISNLGKTTWTKGQVDEVIPVKEIKEIILIRGETSAPSQIDAYNIIRMIEKAYFEEISDVNISPIYEAVLSTNVGCFYIAIGKQYGIVHTKSNKGIFKKPSNKSL